MLKEFPEAPQQEASPSASAGTQAGGAGALAAGRSVRRRRRRVRAVPADEDFRTLFEFSSIGKAVCELCTGRFLRVNPRLCEMLGYAEAELLERSSHDLTDPADASFEAVVMEPVLRGDQDNWEVEKRFRCRDGSTVWVHLSARVLQPEQGGPLRVIASATDITARKRAEADLLQVNRTLTAHSRCSRALLDAANERDYLQAICGVIVECCCHSMVWIGFSENDEDKSVRPLVSAGFEQGYLETLRLTWADTEHGRGPTGTAIRTGQPVSCRNILTDPLFAPWREQAQKRGFASSLVVPLLDQGKAFGSISIYSRIPEAFSDDEIRLLAKLADDVAQGVLTFRLREKHRQAEAQLMEALRDAQERAQVLDAIFTYVPEGLTLVSADGAQVLRLSRHGQELAASGEPGAAAPPGTGSLDLLRENGEAAAPEDWPLARATGRGEVVRNEVWLLKRPDGTRLPILCNAGPIIGTDGEITGGLMAWRDVSDLKQAEAESKARQDLLQSLLDNTPGIIYIKDRAGRLQMVNRAFSELAGRPVEEILGRSYRELFTGASLDTIAENDRLVFEENRRMIFEEVLELPDGRHTYVSCKVPVEGMGFQDRVLIGITTDVTELKRTAEALSRQRAKLEAVIDAMTEGVLVFDSSGAVVMGNRAQARLCGYETVAEMMQQLDDFSRVFELQRLNGAVVPFEQWPASRVLRGEVIAGEEFRIRRLDTGATWVFSISGQPVSGSGARLGVVISRDITELKHFQTGLERLVEERTAKVSEMMTELEHFSYSLIHDMRAPLRAMGSFAEMLDETLGPGATDEQKDYVRRIMVAAERMDALVRDALHYSEAVRTELPVERVDVEALLRGMLETYPQFDQGRADIQIQTGMPCVLANRAGLTQCFSNLLSNAIKFANPGQRPRIRITAGGQNGYVRFSVRDYGIGIPKPMLPRIFNMFVRGPDQRTGTGIGLALVRKVAERMGGRAGVEPAPDQGSVFWVELKAAEGRPQRELCGGK